MTGLDHISDHHSVSFKLSTVGFISWDCTIERDTTNVHFNYFKIPHTLKQMTVLHKIRNLFLKLIVSICDFLEKEYTVINFVFSTKVKVYNLRIKSILRTYTQTNVHMHSHILHFVLTSWLFLFVSSKKQPLLILLLKRGGKLQKYKVTLRKELKN